MGHTDIRTTRIYVDVAAELRKSALEKLSDQLGLAALLPDGATTAQQR